MVFTWDPKWNLTGTKFCAAMKTISFTLLFIMGQIKLNFVSGWSEKNGPLKNVNKPTNASKNF